MFSFTKSRPAFLSLVLPALVLTVQAAVAADAPRAWPANQFAPLTLERIAALPAAERPAWTAYWKASEKLAGKAPGRSLADFSPLQPLTNRLKGGLYNQGLRLDAPAAWYAGDEARTIAGQVVACQTAAGAWTKGNNYTLTNPPARAADIWSNGTYDNNATIFELRYLALVNIADRHTPHSAAWRKAFLRGLRYIFASQYPNGGFPQVYPLAGGYHDNITFNDTAMVNVLELLRDVAAGKPEFEFVPVRLRQEAGRRVERGVHCILATQIKGADGRRTAWCQQHDALTRQPAAARNFEPIAVCSLDSAALAKFLMSRPHPSPEIVGAVDDALAWFRRTPIENIT
jgi:PelA/Pel-15E family pectate lyase